MGGCPSVGCPPPRGLAAPYHPACPTPGTVWTVRPLPVWGRPQGTHAHSVGFREAPGSSGKSQLAPAKGATGPAEPPLASLRRNLSETGEWPGRRGSQEAVRGQPWSAGVAAPGALPAGAGGRTQEAEARGREGGLQRSAPEGSPHKHRSPPGPQPPDWPLTSGWTHRRHKPPTRPLCRAREGSPVPHQLPGQTHRLRGQGSAGAGSWQALGPHHLVLLHVGQWGAGGSHCGGTGTADM